MAVLTVQQIARTGLDATTLAAAAAGGDSFANDGKRFLRVKNGHATLSRTVTIAAQIPVGAVPQGAVKTDLAVVVPALKEYLIGPFDPAGFNDANGRVVVTYSTEADLTVMACAL
jgi:hypothetical protein